MYTSVLFPDSNYDFSWIIPKLNVDPNSKKMVTIHKIKIQNHAKTPPKAIKTTINLAVH